MTYVTCTDCINYAETRFSVLAPAMAERRAETGETSEQIIARYMTGVHDRHLSGLPLLAQSSSADLRP